MIYFNAFFIGGLICTIGQILLNKTKLTNARIVIIFVFLGCLFGYLGLYEKLVDFAGAGATVPITGFGYLLSKGVKLEIDKQGFLGIFCGGLIISSIGISFTVLFSFLMTLFFKSKDK